MKKSLILMLLMAGLTVSLTVFANNNQTITLGYAQSHIQNFKDIHGINVQYRYEWDSPLSVLASFSYMKGKNNSSQEFGREDIKIYSDVKYYSLLAGPAYRINPWLNLYAAAGFANGKANATVDWFHHVKTHVSQREKNFCDKATSFAYGAGFILNPLTNISLNIGYEGIAADIEGKHSINGFNIGLGYRF